MSGGAGFLPSTVLISLCGDVLLFTHAMHCYSSLFGFLRVF